jgi:DNA-binding response OmpR family regulator
MEGRVYSPARRLQGFLRRMKLSLSEVFSTLARAGGAPRILCADDDPDVRELCVVALSRAGFATDAAANGREALEKLNDNDYAAILLDLSMPSIHGATILNVLQRERPEILRRIIVVTGMPDAVVDGVRVPVAAVLRKPVNVDALVAEVNNCLNRQSKHRVVEGDSTARI